MWSDELATHFLTSQPSVHGMMRAILDGVDLAPPLYDLTVRSVPSLIHGDALRVRFPSTVGFFVMCLSVFVFVRARAPGIYALIAMVLAAELAWRYASEGRCYGAVIGCAGLAMVFWQAAAENKARKWTVPALGTCLAAAISFHYYAVFLLCAFVVAEAARFWTSHEFDRPTLVAVTLPSLVLVLHLPLIWAGLPLAKDFWFRVPAAATYDYYIAMLFPLLPFFLVAALLSGIALLTGLSKNQSPGFRGPEWALMTAIALMPELVICLALFTTKVFVDRYVLWSVVGLAPLIAAALCRVAQGNRLHGALLFLPLLIWSVSAVRGAWSDPPKFRYSEGLQQELPQLSQEQIVFSNPHPFMELSYYAAPNLRKRLTYVIDGGLERRYDHSRSNFFFFSALRQREPLGVVDFQDFCRSSQSFILVDAATSLDAGASWLTPHLRNLGYRLSALKGAPPSFTIYQVNAPAGLNCRAGH